MDIFFTVVLFLYLAVFMLIGILDLRRVKSFTDYSVAGKSQSAFAVLMTLLATVIGASTTIGITDTVYSVGFPGIWWLMFGAIGLILQSFFISEKVRATGADTLPELAKILVGGAAEKLIAAVIVISWIGVIAGQLVAMNSLIVFATGKNSKLLFVIVSLIVVGYTLIGGQMSVVKTDKIQLIIILLGVVICCGYLYLIKGDASHEVLGNIELLNENYRPMNLLTQFFVIGGVYFLGPDIMSRNFIAKDEKTAKRSALISGMVLIAFSFIITLIGMWVRYNVTADELGDGKALMYVIGLLPKPVAILMIFGLLSAILSSTDTCIINASTIFVKDILGKENVSAVRITVAVMGVLATLLAVMGRGDIMSLLTGAYSIYTPGVIFPLLVAVLCYKKKEIRKWVWLLASVLGGLFGIAGTYFGTVLLAVGIPSTLLGYLSLIGMGVSLLVSLLSIKK